MDIIGTVDLRDAALCETAATPRKSLFNYIPAELVPDEQVRKKYTCPDTNHLLLYPLQNGQGDRTCKACVISKVYAASNADINKSDNLVPKQVKAIDDKLKQYYEDKCCQRELMLALANISLKPVKCLYDDCNISFLKKKQLYHRRSC